MDQERMQQQQQLADSSRIKEHARQQQLKQQEVAVRCSSCFIAPCLHPVIP